MTYRPNLTSGRQSSETEVPVQDQLAQGGEEEGRRESVILSGAARGAAKSREHPLNVETSPLASLRETPYLSPPSSPSPSSLLVSLCTSHSDSHRHSCPISGHLSEIHYAVVTYNAK